MPRRNRRPRGPRWDLLRAADERPPTTDDLARDLVDRGLAAPIILGPLGPPRHRSADRFELHTETNERH